MEAKFKEILENLEATNDLSPELEKELLAKIKGGVDPLEPPDPLIDPVTGEPIIPGEPIFTVDPITGEPIVTIVDPITGEIIITTVAAMGGVT